jgi:hypothetical protein
MIPRHAELALFNRIINRFYEMPSPKAADLKFRHPIALPSFESHADDCIETLIENLKKTSKRFDAILMGLPAFRLKNLHQANLMPVVPANRQIEWLMLLCRLRALTFMADVGGENTRQINQTHFNDIHRLLASFDIEQAMIQHVPESVYFEASAMLSELMNRGGIR